MQEYICGCQNTASFLLSFACNKPCFSCSTTVFSGQKEYYRAIVMRCMIYVIAKRYKLLFTAIKIYRDGKFALVHLSRTGSKSYRLRVIGCWIWYPLTNLSGIVGLPLSKHDPTDAVRGAALIQVAHKMSRATQSLNNYVYPLCALWYTSRMLSGKWSGISALSLSSLPSRVACP